MLSRLGRMVRERFDQRLAEEFPQFKRHRNVTVPWGTRVYRWKIADDLVFYILLGFARKSERFFIWFIWTESDELPHDLGPLGPDVHKNGVTCFTISRLWHTGQCHLGWELVPEADEDIEIVFRDDYEELAASRIEPAIEDAISKMKQHLTPYMHRVAKERGHEL